MVSLTTNAINVDSTEFIFVDDPDNNNISLLDISDAFIDSESKKHEILEIPEAKEKIELIEATGIDHASLTENDNVSGERATDNELRKKLLRRSYHMRTQRIRLII